jgi:mannose-6-phosphate isomerase-like protein (cupin superfamily)
MNSWVSADQKAVIAWAWTVEGTMKLAAVDINQKFSLFADQWSPKVVAKVNNYLVKIGKLQGDFVWHKHDETDELFLVNKGVLRVDLREGQVFVKKGQMFVVPKGVEHLTHADEECELIMFEPETTRNTGNVKGEMTVEKLEWI